MIAPAKCARSSTIGAPVASSIAPRISCQGSAVA
jgi:hypothetical protein